MSDAAARPAWPGATGATGAPARPERRTIDLKVVIAVLIGLVSVSGAVITWRSAQLSEFATDKDRQAIAETVRLQQDEANNEITVQDARSRVATHAAALAAAESLEAQAERLTGAGDDAGADLAADEAVEQRAVAERALQGGPTNLALDAYVRVDDASGRRTLDTAQLRDDLRAQSSALSQVNPSQTVREGNRLRTESQRLDGWLVPLIGAIVVLTAAQISRRQSIRYALTGLAVIVWIASVAFAFGGGS